MRRKILNKGMKISSLVLGILVIFSGAVFGQKSETREAKKNFKIGLAVLKDNPDYHTGRSAFVTVLEEQKDMKVEFRTVDAYGNLESYKKGLENLVKEEKVNLIFTTGTRSTLPAVELIKDTPIIFTAVASPVDAGIVKSLEKPGGNVTGTHCAVPANAQVKTIIKVLPDAKRLGIVYTAGEPNAEIQTQDFKDAAQELGLQVLTATVSKDCKTEEEVSVATKKLIGKVDVVIGHQDTTISRYGRGMIQTAEENNIPTYVSLGQLLAQGAVFSLGIDFNRLGTLSGEQAVKILKEKTKPADIPVDTDKNYALLINLSAAKKIDLNIPVQVLKAASKVIK